MLNENENTNPETPAQMSEAEIALKIKELDLRERELDLKKSQIDLKQEGTMSPVTASIIVGLVAAIAAIISNCNQGIANVNLEQKKFESVLIQKAVEPKDKNEQMRNLQFLVTTGLIKDEGNKIMNINLNQLPATSSSPQVALPILEGTWAIALETDISLEDARNNIWKMAKQNGYSNAYVFKQPEGYRTVVIFKTKEEAMAQIPNAKKINETVSDEPKELSVWCGKRQWNQEQQYFDCGQ